MSMITNINAKTLTKTQNIDKNDNKHNSAMLVLGLKAKIFRLCDKGVDVQSLVLAV